MIWTLTALITYLVVGVIGGTATEQIAKRKFWPPLGWLGAVLVAFGGSLIGAWFFADVLGFKEPRALDVPLIPTLVGLIIFMIPWFMVRGGYTGYGKKRTWQRKYRR